MTPEGMKRTENVAPNEVIPQWSRRKFSAFVVGLALIAVLPFENLSSDKENAYFAEGIQDEILTRLAKIGAVKVISMKAAYSARLDAGAALARSRLE